MDIGFFINYNDEVIQLPVNPEKVTVTYKGNNSTTEIIQLGQITLIKDRKLAEIGFSSFFPEYEWFPGIRTLGGFKKPEFYKEFFQHIQEEKKPCRLIITGLNITMKCSVENFEYYHQGGDHEDAYYSLDFKEYRDYEIVQIAVDSSLKNTYVYVEDTEEDHTKDEDVDADTTVVATTSIKKQIPNPNRDTKVALAPDGTYLPQQTVAPQKVTVGCSVKVIDLYQDAMCTKKVTTDFLGLGVVEEILYKGGLAVYVVQVESYPYTYINKMGKEEVKYAPAKFFSTGEGVKLFGNYS